MSAGLPSDLLVAALRQRVQAAGGFATVLARGEKGSGALLLILRGPGGVRAMERMPSLSGGYELAVAGPLDGDESTVDAYWHRRRERDPDLWVVELDVAEAQRFAAETILGN